jgi:hypothetical protein
LGCAQYSISEKKKIDIGIDKLCTELYLREEK